MKSKIVKQGQATMTVSLPIKWIKNNNLNNGEEINIEEKENKLILSSSKSISDKIIKIDLSKMNERVIRWSLSSLHKKGYDEIEIIFDSPKTLIILEDLTKNLFTGFVIIEQTSKRCVLKSISADSQSEFNNILRRAFLVCLSLADNSLESIENTEELKTLLTLEKSNNQLTNFCERLINKGLYQKPKLSHFTYVIVWNLEKVCDDYKDMCEKIIKEEIKLNKETLNYYQQTNSLVREYYELFFKFNFESLNKLTEKAKKISLAIMNKNEFSIIDHHLLNIINKVKDFSASTIALNN